MTTNAIKTYAPCHSGNFNLYTNDGSLFLGGWNKGASFDKNTVVIDLADKVVPTKIKTKLGLATFDRFLPRTGTQFKDWLTLDLTDYGVPAYDADDWSALCMDVVDILGTGTDVLIACEGGHGRTGMVGSILGYMLLDGDWKVNPVYALSVVYCNQVIDTENQENYVYKILGLDLKADPSRYAKAYTKQATKYDACPFCNTESWNVDTYGLCYTCQAYYEGLIKKAATKTGKDIHSIKIKPCKCGAKKCDGVFMSKCKHIVHDQSESFEAECNYCFSLHSTNYHTIGVE